MICKIQKAYRKGKLIKEICHRQLDNNFFSIDNRHTVGVINNQTIDRLWEEDEEGLKKILKEVS